jgi:membrane protein implicated in regulation of membrane protease activity
MDPWVFWVIAAVLLGAGEIMTVSFFLAPFAIGALLAALADVLGAGWPLSWGVFLVSSVLLLTLVRPIARRHLKTPPRLRTGTDALIGTTATVVERVTGEAGTVRLAGEIWTARPFDEDTPIEAGTRVHVVEIRGATALVTET